MPNDMNKVTMLSLVYDIRFNDADEGDCYAGQGRKLISFHIDRANAEAIAVEFNPVFAQAEKENTVFPLQKFNRLLKAEFGFTCHDIDDGYNFNLVAETFDVEG
jgi:hypothetical protein